VETLLKELKSSVHGKLNISLHGAYHLSLGERELALSGLVSKKLLAVLACQKGKSVSRSSLSALFWEDSSETQARQNLRQLLYQLRGQLGDWDGLSVEREFLSLDKAKVVSDIELLMAKLSSGTVSDSLLCIDNFSDGLFEWFGDTGELLSSWVELARRDISQRLCAELERIMNLGNEGQSVRAAQALQKIDSVDESSAQFLLRHYASMGNTGRALKIYQQLWEQLDVDYGMEPSAVTTNLIAEIKSGTYDSMKRESHGTVDVYSSKKITVDILSCEVPSAGSELICVSTAFRGALLDSLHRFREFQVVDCSKVTSGSEYQLASRIVSLNECMNLSLTLLQTQTGVVLWTESFENIKNAWWLSQAETAGAIAAACSHTLSKSHLQSINSRSVQARALDEWLSGQQNLFMFRPDRFDTASKCFERAVALDSSFSRAYSSLSQLINSRHMSCPGEILDRSMLKQSKRYAIQAITLDPFDSLAQLCSAWASCLLEEYDQASYCFDTALSCNPDDPWTEISVALGKIFVGDSLSAEELAAKSIVKIWARTPVYWAYHCTIRFLQSDYSGAVRAAENADGAILNIHGWHAAALWRMNRREEAMEQWIYLNRLVAQARAPEKPMDRKAICTWFCNGFPIRSNAVRQQLKDTITEVSEAHAKLQIGCNV
jgi:DNA-binding SARP family transcriptional activator